MSPLKKLDINQLPEKERDNYKKINKLSSKDDLSKKLNDNFFKKLESGTAMIERHDGDLIFKQKDINATSLINRKGQTFEGTAFRVDKKLLKRYLKDEEKKETITNQQRLLLEELGVTLGNKKEIGGLQEEVILTNDAEILSVDISTLIDWLKNNKDWPKAPKFSESQNTKKRYKQIIKDDLSLLKSIKRELKNYTYSTNIDYFVSKINKIKSHKIQLEKTRQIIATGGDTSEIPAILDSMKDVKREALFQNIAANYNIEYNKILKDTTMLKLRNEDMEGFQDYLEKVWSGEIEHPEQDKFYAEHKKDFDYLKNKNPSLYAEIIQNRKSNRNTRPNNNYYTGDYKTKYEKQKERCSNGRGAFEKGGNLLADKLADWGIIDKNNPKQKEAWKKFGKIGMMAGALVLGFKFLQKLFSKKGTENKRRDTMLFGGGLLALLKFDKVSKRGKDAFGISKSGTADPESIATNTNTDIETVNTYITPQITTMAALGGAPINTLIEQKMVIEKNGKIKIDYDKYVSYIDASNGDKDEKKIIKANLEKIKDNESILQKGLNSFGVDGLDDMKKIAGKDNEKTLLDSDKMADYFESLSSGVNADLAEDGLKPKNAKAWYEITQEYKDPNNDAQIADWMKKGLLELDDSKPYNIDDMVKNPNIDLKNKKMKGLDIKFDSYENLFGAIDLTDFIKETFKTKSANSANPFHISISGNIQFDNKDRWEWKGDTDVINANYYKNTLKNISTTLDDKKNKYVDFLNKRYREILAA